MDSLVLASDGARLDGERVGVLGEWLGAIREWEINNESTKAASKLHDDLTVISVVKLA